MLGCYARLNQPLLIAPGQPEASFFIYFFNHSLFFLSFCTFSGLILQTAETDLKIFGDYV